ncbi:hypothetical protein Mycch_4164 [Mycolicibacterium chubuense NBB4]|uniref:DUF4383 domain-containing protein n=2 Tax=Mycolicibacterium chubuense TaxID=1800 RepID=I4BNM5_MYCCN|nr:hypothetical protein Mycch_4164 [Mycolicibacterium chubuense NBB4]
MSREMEMPAAPKYMAVQVAAAIVAAVLVVLGVLGFIPGVTTHLGQLSWAGQRSHTFLFGTFAVSAVQNIVHLVVGAAGALMARTYAGARAYLLAGGVVYLGLWLYGLLVTRGSDADLLPLNQADNWLHLGLGGVMVLLAVTLAGQHDPTKRRTGLRRHVPSH